MPIERYGTGVRCQSSSRRDGRGAWSASIGPRSRDFRPGEAMAEAVPLEVIEQRIGYRFQDRALLAQALVHASIATVRTASNERLEFLGDAILGAIVCEHLYRRFPNDLEGELTKIKSLAVSRRVCAELAAELGLADAVQLGKGMGERTNLPQSLLAALFEAVIGAVYLDGGIEPARAIILRLLDARIDVSARLGHQQNFKSVLQQALQQRELGTPVYVVLGEQGPDHAKCFEICVEIGPRRFKSRQAMSKKAAEQEAALEALVELGVVDRDEDGEIRVRPDAAST
jgi:ribonuclease-3